ncbi:hypothetical protein AAFF_G00032820 [Aldrovandia affinis]|uniref:Uncharacterized protein n=1 Tax=Aldrovandia affinis TaxID=143900 RepID=A0AAD7R2C0_9TELE|nr:hypothetical protein AAFF_G00032820 [Aldrovandia affinis]
MPRKGKRSQAAKQRWQPLDLADQPISPSTQQTAQPETPPPAASPWTKTRRMRSPPRSLQLRSDSHLRAIADGFVAMPDGALSFGVLSIPGASAAELRTEVLNVVLPRTPEAVHLSDDAGMEILARLVWAAASQQLERPTRVATVQRTSQRTSPPARRVSPKVVVMDEVAVPRPSSPFEWTVVGRTTKTAQPETPPPAPSPWTKKDAITPSQSPAQKMARLPIAALAAPVVGRTKKMARLPIAALAAPVVGRTKKTAQPETPPPAPSPWTKKDAITPSQSPAQKMARLPIAALAAPVVGRTKKTHRPAEPEQQRTTEDPTVQRPSPRTSPPARRVSPKVVVKDEVGVPRPSSPFEWTVVGRTKKVQCPVCLPQLLLDGTGGRNASVTCPSPDNIWETGWLFATIPKEHLIVTILLSP